MVALDVAAMPSRFSTKYIFAFRLLQNKNLTVDQLKEIKRKVLNVENFKAGANLNLVLKKKTIKLKKNYLLFYSVCCNEKNEQNKT